MLGGLAACSGADGSDLAERGDASPTDSSTRPSGAGPSGGELQRAFFAGVPLVVTMRTMQTFAGLVGVNKLFTTSTLADASSKYVVAPNHDTLYAIAVLDLRAGPVELRLPDITDRYHVVQILNAWMGGVALLGTRATGGRAGSWVVVGPGYDGPVPAEAARLDCPTNHAFVLGRIRAVDGDDVARAAGVAKRIELRSLAEGSAPAELAAPAGPPQTVGENGAAFFDELCGLLTDDAPVSTPAQEALDAVAPLIAAGARPTVDASDQVPALQAAVDAGMAGLAQGLAASGQLLQGWQVNLGLGDDGSRLPVDQQAMIARYFWGPVPAAEAVYPRAVQASDGEPLDGTKRYRIHLPGDDLPPVDAFWSFTVYGEDLFFVPNEINRFSISGDLPGLVRQPDGSVDLLLTHIRPTDPAVNWLPIPGGPFTLLMRLYLPQADVLQGSYRYPPIEVITG